MKTLTEEHKRNIGLAHKGMKHTEETKRNLSETRKRLYAEGKIIHSWLGRKHTEETKRKISENHHACSGSNNSQWKGGVFKSRGDKYIHSPNHPNRTKANYVKESRLIMEKKIDGYLTREEVVHHLDGDKTNNDPNNLHLFKNQSEHWTYHLFLRRIVKKIVRGETYMEEDIKTIKKNVMETRFMLANLQYRLIPERKDCSEHLRLAKILVSEINPPELMVEGKYPRKQPRTAASA